MNLPLCQCGCGKEVTKRKNKYIWGHNRSPVSQETKEKLRKPKGTYEQRYGKEKADEIKKRIGEKSKNRKQSTKGLTIDEYHGSEKADEIRRRISEKIKGRSYLKNRIGKNNPAYTGAKDCLYSHYHLKLWADENRENIENNKIEVKCKYCGKWFTPKQSELDNRINTLRHNKDLQNFYCSNECKQLCPIFLQVLWPKNHKPYDNKYLDGESFEVSSEVRKMVFERDNWTCQKCDLQGNLHCHHIDPRSQEPMFEADIDSCITLCKNCHKFVHTEIDGCKYHELRKIC